MLLGAMSILYVNTGKWMSGTKVILGADFAFAFCDV